MEKQFSMQNVGKLSTEGQGVLLTIDQPGIGIKTPIWGPTEFQEAIHEELVQITVSVETVDIETNSEVTYQPPDEGSPQVKYFDFIKSHIN